MHRRRWLQLRRRIAVTPRDGILLTGAGGLVGGLLLPRLAADYPHRTIVALLRTSNPTAASPNVHFIQGDISRPRLGLSDDVYACLCRSVGTIVHCAASTKFTLPLPESRAVNVTGTANIVELARRSSHLKMLLHVSTTYIAGRKTGPLPEAPMTEPAGRVSPYEQSKFEAEQFLCDHAADIPWAIVRLSTVIGNSQTGHVSRPNYFHQLLRFVPRNPLPYIPGDPDVLVDLVADDWVTAGLLEILRTDPSAGAVFHLCAGPEQSMPAREIVDMLFRPRGLAVPSFITTEQFQAFATELQQAGDTNAARLADLLLLCLPHLGVAQSFLNCKTNRLLEQRGLRTPVLRDFLPRIVGIVD